MLAVGLLGGLAWMRLSGQAGDLVQAVLLLGVPIGVIHALAFGGYACIAHAAMRLVLRRSNALPLDLVPFLEYATERVFLRRVGGGYVFVHRLLQEYFAVHPNVSDAITTGRFLQAGAPPAAARAASAAPGHSVASGGLVDTLDAEGGRVLVIGGQQAGTIDARAVYATAELDPRMRKDRDRMLGRVRRLWIQGRLDQLAHADPLEPRVIQERPDAVPDRWSALVQQPDRPSPARWSERTLLDGFDAFDGELLILGEAGMGKTRLLLELCGALLDRAEQEDVLPVPAVFALSAWSAARQRLPLSTWLANELTGRYAVPSPIAARWVAEDRILPLLDGLDRVPAAQRSACVSAITTFREGRTRDLLGLVVTSRTADYLALDVRLTLRGAVEVHRGA
jgi:hypothetical protein